MAESQAPNDVAIDAVTRPGFTAVEITQYDLIRLQVFSRQPGIESELSSRVEHPMPAPGESISEAGREWYWSAPGEWVVAVPAGSGTAEIDTLKTRLAGLYAVLTPMTDSRTCIEVSGAEVRQVLARGTTIDLTPSAFNPGKCAITRFASIAVMLVCAERDDSFRLFAESSYRQYLFEWLEAACRDC